MAIDVSHHIGEGIGVFLTAALMAWIHHRARRPVPSDPFSGEKILKFGGIYGSLALFSILLSGIGTFAALYYSYHDPQIGVAEIVFLCGSTLAYLLLSLYMISLWLGHRIVLGDQGITRHSPWRLPLTIQWNEVERISLSKGGGSFLVFGKDGQKIKISNELNGFGDFASEIRRRLPRR